MQTPTVGVCVLNWNAGEALIQCIESLQATDQLTLVVVDNASTDGSREAASKKFPNIPIILNASNFGYSTGNNIGAAYLFEANCDVLIFINPDVTISSAALHELVDTLWSNPGTGCVGGVPSTPTGRACVAARTRPSPLEALVFCGPLNRIGPLRRLLREHFIDPADLTDGCEVYALNGACIAFRAEAFRQIDGFDERTFLYAEEYIMAERLRAWGWKVRLSKRATYHHTEAVSSRRMPYRRKLHGYASEFYLLLHYYGWNPLLCGLIWLYRHAEWLACLPLWFCQLSILPLLRLRTVNVRPKGYVGGA